MFKLKGYQQRAVDVMQTFLAGCLKANSVAEAYSAALAEQDLPEHAYQEYGFGQTPYFCLRIPTGGGKTVLGSYAVEVAAQHYLESDAPITLWLVPSITIRQQTVEALKTPGHPYRQNLDRAFNRQVLVLDIDEVTQIRPQDIGSKAIVVVSTLANLRVTDTSGRKVYAYHENFEPHFARINSSHPSWSLLERVTENDLQENGLTKSELGKIKFSFANLLAVYRPIVIVDEAHNARTSLTFDTLHRVHPKVIIELTATPNTTNTNGSNVLFHVSAAELKAEEMIKLPIMLTEHVNWQDALRDAVITRNKLAVDAQKDTDYIRPIVLFQAENKNGEVTVEVLKNHLTEHLNIEANKIAVVTGNQRELDGINLFDQSCPIEYIITIEALKEGWDCSFAYVFCSVKQVSSSKDAEQLLGRVLRMPYAKRRVIEDLNRAYAHLATKGFSKVASELTDTLVAMGFEEMEIAAFLREQAPHAYQDDLFGNSTPQPPRLAAVPTLVVEVENLPDLSTLSELEKQQIAMTTDESSQTAVVRISGEVSENIKTALSQYVKSGKNRQIFERDIRVHNQSIQARKAPSERGEVFSPLPQLCMMQQGQLELVESEVLLHACNWNLLDYPAELKNFTLHETSSSFAIDFDGKKVTYKISEQKDVVPFNQGMLDITEQDLVRWLDNELRQTDVVQHQLASFIGQLINNLLKQYGMTLTALERNKFPLARAIRDLIHMHRAKAQSNSYQLSMFDSSSTACLSDDFLYAFKPDKYPSRPPYYTGRFTFDKHFFPQGLIEDLKSSGEEFECAKVIEGLPEVKYWIRNLVRRDDASFWLPLAHSKFYPDFVCELTDGRMLVVEYKGEVYASNDDSAEKRAVGNKWAELSSGRCLFVMAVKHDQDGRDVKQQILKVIES
ncbi:restriction endonuclease subunit R [Pseudomonas sp. C27(2019)]|uniref:DEAD/DEAH box helicase n=1 Tax=Pseudomonas sp. C27(2019) TaxID=2604941 RepID=UPI001246B77A|nr:DEAD/DEAH box helicase family protein [Pseudomonas sp. C27(2019)]QEY59728.1 restriction endonuclease subunit R [Pseudomonas sp. C27(2019)]